MIFILLYEEGASLVDAGESHGEGAGKNVTTPINLTKTGAKVGDQGVLQTQFLSNGNLTFQCADVKVVDAKGGAGGTGTNDGISSFVGAFEVTFFVTILATVVMAL